MINRSRSIDLRGLTVKFLCLFKECFCFWEKQQYISINLCYIMVMALAFSCQILLFFSLQSKKISSDHYYC